MTDVIKVTINERHFVSCSTETIARKGEGEYPRLVIEIPNRLSGMWPYLDFKKPSGETFKTPRLAIDGNIIEYDLPLSVLNEKGTLEMQLVLQNGKGRIWKSNVKRFKVLYSIDATGDIENDEDFVDYVENMVESALKELELVCIVMELPEEGVPNKTYFVPKPDGVDNDLYDEYMWIDGAWEYFGTKTIEVDLTDYVKNTDYAGNGKYGVITTHGNYGVDTNYAGLLCVMQASNELIAGKQDKFRPITPFNLDYAVKSGITTNTETLTDEEKTAACEWLGALPQYEHAPLQKEINIRYLYGVDAYTGKQIMYQSTNYNLAIQHSIPMRGHKGAIYIPDDACGDDVLNLPAGEIAVNKNYVDAMGGVFYAEYGVTKYAEIQAAIEAGKAVFLTYFNMGQTYYFTLSRHAVNSEPLGYSFSCVYPLAGIGHMMLGYANVNEADEWSEAWKTIALE